tara:strand:+ start:444 stop:914 length:471 start_codon:yes stop_codon:yes gene_type:complete
MINNLLSLINSENIYLLANWGVIPFWIMLIIFPNHSLTNFFAQSILVPLLLAIAYGYLSYNLYLEENIFDGFELYSGLDGLYSMFANETLLLVFWLHFLAISLFAGAWVVRDSKKYLVPKIITIPSLILIYFTGPVGIVIYWFFRIFFARKISFND